MPRSLSKFTSEALRVRVKPVLRKMLVAECKRKGVSATQVVDEALELYFNRQEFIAKLDQVLALELDIQKTLNSLAVKKIDR